MSVCFIQFFTLPRSLLSLSPSVCLSSLYLSLSLTHSLSLCSLFLSLYLSLSLTHSLSPPLCLSLCLSLSATPTPSPTPSLSRFWRKGVKSFLQGPIPSDPRITTSRAKNYRFRFHLQIQCIEN